MITSILIDRNQNYFDELNTTIRKLCPKLKLIAYGNSIADACRLITSKKPDLVFMGLSNSTEFRDKLFCRFESINFETIIISKDYKLAIDAIRFCAIGYLKYPIIAEEFFIAVQNALTRIEQKKVNLREKRLMEEVLGQIPTAEVIGIPTMEGLDFLRVADIIRCEGLQKCTRVIAKGKKSIISSYNLGEFRKLLEPYGFYSPHKSYLINLKLICKYHKEGSIKMVDGNYVPVAKRKKSDFLNQIKHI